MKPIARFLSLLVLSSLLITGCTAASKPDATKPVPDTAVVDPTKPVQGGIYTKALGGDPGNLDPIVKSDVNVQMISMQIFSNLIRYDAVEKKFVNDVASGYKISDDGKTYTFTLNKGVLFHNGRELKAQDVKYTYERMLDPKSVTQNAWDQVVGAVEMKKGDAKEISGIKVNGDYELTITLKEPKPTLLLDIAGPGSGIVPKEEVEKLGPDFGQKPVGSGPFKFKQWNKDDKVVLEAFDKFYGGRPYVDQVVFRIMKEEQTRDAEFLASTLDSMVLGESLYKKYTADPERSKGIIEVPELFTRAIHFNTTKAPFDNVKVRQAINYAIDKKAIVEKVLNNKAFPATGVLPSSSPAYDPSLKGYEFSPDKAKALLKDAGFEKGFEFEVLVTSTTAKWMEAMNTYLNPLGINGKIVQMESATLLSNAREGKYQAVIFSTGGDTDPVSFLGRFESKNFGKAGNVTLYKNEQVDKILADASRTIDQATRIDMARQAEKIIVAETPWFIFNYNKAVLIAQPWVHGLRAVPTDIDFQDLSKVWLSKKK